ncbi:MAG: TonB-dependent receptor [Methylophaga sp.]|nr:TonB-dependent receptor [Methylophaga sp.]
MFSHRTSLLNLLIAQAVFHPVYADTAQTELDQLVVTASRLDDVDRQPASISIISEADIKASPSQTLAALLAEQAGINLSGQLNEHPNSGSVDIRGFGETAGQNTLILLDGRRLNDVDLSNVNYAAIPTSNIERIEISRGSGAVLYGGGASGGVINIITKNPTKTDQTAVISGKYGSDNLRELNAFGSINSEQLAINANINRMRSDGYRDNNHFEQDSGQIDFRLPVKEDEIYLKLGAFDNETGLPGVRSVNPDAGINQLKTDRRGTDTPDDWAKERTEYLTLGYTHQINTNDRLVIDGGYRDRQQKAQLNSFGGSYLDTTLQTFSLTPRLVLNRTASGMPLRLISGIDWYDYDYDSDRSDFRENVNQPFRQLDVEQNSLAFYGQAILSLTDKTTLTGGLRTQQVRTRARDTFDVTANGGAASFSNEAAPFNDEDRENSWELGVKHNINEQWSGFIRADRSVRFGTVDELFQFGNMGQEFSDIKPQTAHGYEIGVGYQAMGLNADLTFFQQELENEIRYNPITFQNENLDDTRRRGIEFSMAANLTNNLKLISNYTYLDAEFRDGPFDGNTNPLVPEHSYLLGFRASLPADIMASLNWQHVSATYFANDLTNDFNQKIPSYQRVDLSFNKSFNNLDFTLAVNNLFDEKYFSYGVNSTFGNNYNAYPLPERTVTISAAYQFD